MAEFIIVSRHKAAVQFIRDHDPRFEHSRVIENATEDDIYGNIVAGNLPMKLARLCKYVVAVEFRNNPPRGQEYTTADMEAAGGYLQAYTVRKAGDEYYTE